MTSVLASSVRSRLVKLLHAALDAFTVGWAPVARLRAVRRFIARPQPPGASDLTPLLTETPLPVPRCVAVVASLFVSEPLRPSSEPQLELCFTDGSVPQRGAERSLDVGIGEAVSRIAFFGERVLAIARRGFPLHCG